MRLEWLHLDHLTVDVAAVCVGEHAQVPDEHIVKLGVVLSEQIDVVAVELAARRHVLQLDHGEYVLLGGYVDELQEATHLRDARGHQRREYGVVKVEVVEQGLKRARQTQRKVGLLDVLLADVERGELQCLVREIACALLYRLLEFLLLR